MRVNESLIRDIFRLFIWFPFRWTIQNIPIRGGFLLFKLAGSLHFYAGKGKRKRIYENIRTLLNLDDTAALCVVRKNFEIHYLDRLHIFLYPKLTTKEKILRYVQFENLELLEKELQNGRGSLIVQPHFGPVQVTLLALGLHGLKPMQIGYPSDTGLSFIGKSIAYKYRLKYEGMLPPIVAADK